MLGLHKKNKREIMIISMVKYHDYSIITPSNYDSFISVQFSIIFVVSGLIKWWKYFFFLKIKIILDTQNLNMYHRYFSFLRCRMPLMKKKLVLNI